MEAKLATPGHHTGKIIPKGLLFFWAEAVKYARIISTQYINNGMFKVITSKSKSGHLSSVKYTTNGRKNVLDKFDTNLLYKIKELEVA
ncbi:hypothetical protein [Lacrimispora celerecrescens]|uniref:hypothetical protein n=1 Tax=Lacrimispora celerecrescens TaxID=29354 RepID=UPI000C242490|nr:hypothetical protein [Lacrimispora celerecrescens]